MRTHRCSVLPAAACVAAAALALPASADSIWDESVDGDLSDDRLAPTSLVLSLGTNSVTATSMQGDREYVTFSLAPGLSLSQLILVSYASVDLIAFIAVQEGSVFTEPPTMTNVANLLGWTHFGDGLQGLDLLPDLGIGAGAIGFTPPLPGGTSYTFWMQQTGVNPATFQFDFIVTPAPPAAAAVALLALAGPTRRRRH